MNKGEATRQAILDHAMGLASSIGLEGLTIGRLANDLELSKSGLFAHFQSKESLQMQILDRAAAKFKVTVIDPTIKAQPGVKRLRVLFENWLNWGRAHFHTGGCFFVAAAAELDDRPGPVRNHFVKLQKDWFRFLSDTARLAAGTGEFRKNLDPDQFAQDFYGIMLSCHHFSRLLHDRRAESKARNAFEALLKKEMR